MTVDNRLRSHTEPAEQAVARVRDAEIKMTTGLSASGQG